MLHAHEHNITHTRAHAPMTGTPVPASSAITRFTWATTRSTAEALALPESSMLDTGRGRRGAAVGGAEAGADQFEPMVGWMKQMAEGVVVAECASSGHRTRSNVLAGSTREAEATLRTDNSTPLCPIPPNPPSAIISPSASPRFPPIAPSRPRCPGSDPRVLDVGTAGDDGTDTLADTLDRRECACDPLDTVSTSTDPFGIFRLVFFLVGVLDDSFA